MSERVDLTRDPYWGQFVCQITGEIFHAMQWTYNNKKGIEDFLEKYVPFPCETEETFNTDLDVIWKGGKRVLWFSNILLINANPKGKKIIDSAPYQTLENSRMYKRLLVAEDEESVL